MNMATPCGYFRLLMIQARRRYVQRRMLRELGWKTGWQRARK